ncbi:uncharacterized protein N7483_009663 [Penicillium malachiteum]|uniref:uncharacterized protein n=1 Tax=Penicillium malachiteum TaxID=1324776 RepID=UPI002548B945|nr:uncharacterized protein N7483_009663 [Penicillium malachiteum]KAJ5721729.1 hypothetical protein N7483_009663 [Penicillium malachiteum]
MPAPCQIAQKKIDPPSIGRNGYQGFLNKSEILPKGSAPFNSRKLTCDILVEHDVGLKVRDGATIYVDVYRPPDGGEKVPAIFSWSPFGKKLNGLKFLEMMPLYDMGLKPDTLSGLEKFEAIDPADFVLRGYAVINANTRGVRDSDGMCIIMGTQEGEDGVDCIEEIAKKPWCNGNVGMAGNSPLAIAQWFIGQLRPPSLKAIAPWEGCGDLFREQFFRGGIYAGNFFDHISQVMIQGNNGMESFKEMYRRSGGVANPYWEYKRPYITNINIPTYIKASFSSALHTMGCIRGFFDVDTPINGSGSEWHDSWAVPKYTEELLSFFDRYLKGIENDWEKIPPIRMTTLRFGSQDAIVDEPIASFPPPQVQDRQLFLSENGSLNLDSQISNTGIASYNSESGASHAAFTYTFDKKTRLCGIPKAVLYMSCDARDDLDVYIIVRKLDKNGKPALALNVPWSSIPPNSIEGIPREKATDLLLYMGPIGMLRESHREIDSSRSMHPNYPFHPHTRTQPVPACEVVNVEFEAGESVQVQVSGQSPQIHSFEELKDKLGNHDNKGVHKIHFGGDHPSYVVLPFA